MRVGDDPRSLLEDWLARRGETAEFRETHTSVVALTRDRVFKMKKAVRFPFVDLVSARQRLDVCLREVALNRRLAPDVYLGVVEITDADGHGRGPAVEMRRLPDSDRLDRLIRGDEPIARARGDRSPAGAGGDEDVACARGSGSDATPASGEDAALVAPARTVAPGDRSARCVRQLAGVMARFHAEALRTDAAGTPDSMRALWTAELDGLRGFSGVIVDPGAVLEAERLATRYIGGRSDLFDARVAGGRIRDGHGDLRADDVFCMPDGLRVIDCLEFDDQLRHGDVLADVAFLAMDLEWLQRADLAKEFLNAYRSKTGDDWPVTLEQHWIAYRAHVRAKVACLRATAGAPGEASARGHLDLAIQHLRAAQVRIILVGGLPGTGKSTVAAALSRALGLPVISTDTVRRETVPGHGGRNRPSEGRYRPAFRNAVYAEVLRRARQLIRSGHSVILDASWTDARHRADAAAVAGDEFADVAALECQAPSAVTEARIERRLRDAAGDSEADADVARAMATDADPWPEAVRLETVGDLDATITAAVEALA